MKKKPTDPRQEIYRRPFLFALLLMGWFTAVLPQINKMVEGEFDTFILVLFLISALFPFYFLFMSWRLRSSLYEKGYDWIKLKDCFVLVMNMPKKKSYIPDRTAFLCLPESVDEDLYSLIKVTLQQGEKSEKPD
jgi:hypothetical protein